MDKQDSQISCVDAETKKTDTDKQEENVATMSTVDVPPATADSSPQKLGKFTDTARYLILVIRDLIILENVFLQY